MIVDCFDQIVVSHAEKAGSKSNIFSFFKKLTFAAGPPGACSSLALEPGAARPVAKLKMLKIKR